MNHGSFFRSDVVDAILVKFPSVNFSIVIGINFAEEIVKSFLNHFFVEEAMGFQFFSDPSLELSFFKNVAAVTVMLKEDVLNEFLAEGIHFQLVQSMIL